jgi:hypothetical protein
MGVESNTNKSKFGDGTTAWNLLPYSLSAQAGDAPNSLKLLGTHEVFFSGSYEDNAYVGVRTIGYNVSEPENQLLFVADVSISDVTPGSSVSNFTAVSGGFSLKVGNVFDPGGSSGSGDPGGYPATASFNFQSPTSGKYALAASGSGFYLGPVGEEQLEEMGIRFAVSRSGFWSFNGRYFLRVYEVYRG